MRRDGRGGAPGAGSGEAAEELELVGREGQSYRDEEEAGGITWVYLCLSIDLSISFCLYLSMYLSTYESLLSTCDVAVLLWR